MVDGEVIRLRQLRERALGTRALAVAMDSGELSLNTALARSAQSCWRIAKVVTGALRGHPNLSCQRDYGIGRAAYDRLNAAFMAIVARRRDTSAQVFCEQLWGVARLLDDVRALTWSGELSATLGRAQLQMRGLLREFEAATRHEARANRNPVAPQRPRTAARASRNASHPAMGRDESAAKSANWPYLAL